MLITENIFLVYYLLGINIFAFIIYGIDKARSKKHLYRISEFKLIALALIGGSVGAWAAMYTFRHKTKHLKFVLGLPLILIAQIIAGLYLLK